MNVKCSLKQTQNLHVFFFKFSKNLGIKKNPHGLPIVQKGFWHCLQLTKPKLCLSILPKKAAPQLEKEGSRGIQFCMMIFHLLHNVTYIICIYYEYYKQKQDGNSFSLWQNLGREQEFLAFCALLVLCGLISSVLSIIQIFIEDDWEIHKQEHA